MRGEGVLSSRFVFNKKKDLWRRDCIGIMLQSKHKDGMVDSITESGNIPVMPKKANDVSRSALAQCKPPRVKDSLTAN